MPIFTGIAAALTAIEAATATIGAVTATGATAAAASGGLAAAGAGLGAAGIGGAGALTAGATAGLTAGAAIAPTAAAATGGLTLGGVATGLGIAGTLASGASTAGQYFANQQAVEEQKKQEALRQKQMALEASRQRREVIRRTQSAQALGVNAAGQSGLDITGGSILSSITGQAQSDRNFQVNAINQNEAIGDALFASNAREAEASGTASLFGGIGDFGKVLASNNMSAARLTNTVAPSLFRGT